MTEYKTKTYVVKSQKLAGYLMLNGFKLHKIEIANDGSNRNIFIFSNSQQLLDSIQVYRKMA